MSLGDHLGIMHQKNCCHGKRRMKAKLSLQGLKLLSLKNNSEVEPESLD